MDWVTRKNIKVDRVACPWLIRKFVDRDANFLFVAEEELLHAANRGAIPFDAPRIPQIKLNHRGDRCTFEAIIEDYKLSAPGLERLALIVRAADIKGQEAAPEGMGLRAIAEGFAAMGLSDSERLRYGFAIYDALLQYAAAGSNQNIETPGKERDYEIKIVGYGIPLDRSNERGVDTRAVIHSRRLERR